MIPVETSTASSKLPGTAESTLAGSRSFSMAQLAALVFLASQTIFVLISRFSDDAWRVLTPVNGLTRYDLHATLAQRVLPPDEIQLRYGIPARAEVGLRPEALQAIVEHCEKPIPLSRAVIVRLHTRRSDGTEEVWLWPQR